jgi:hypothetical protein
VDSKVDRGGQEETALSSAFLTPVARPNECEGPFSSPLGGTVVFPQRPEGATTPDRGIFGERFRQGPGKSVGGSGFVRVKSGRCFMWRLRIRYMGKICRKRDDADFALLAVNVASFRDSRFPVIDSVRESESFVGLRNFILMAGIQQKRAKPIGPAL